MELIITHDHSDFDAVASQFAASRLIPAARPVLSRHINRNVRHFLSLYWDEFPFIRVRDIPKTHIGHVIVVDSQHVATLRGINDHTRVTIIDHHPPSANLNADWHVTVEQLGAAVTLLVERLRKQGTLLTPIEATLLALGIYEDTGALTYGTTTPRDAYAAAWLLEQGALVDVINEFLNHPLSDDQKALYELLVENVETHQIENYPVVITCAEAHDVVEEIATLAHKLRDLLDPAAIFLLVDLGSHVQLVARSTVDEIDVSRVATHFGGGGHGRAAAAIIREETLAQARRSLLACLPDVIIPGITVVDLMSYGVKRLSPETKVRDAAKEMRRYGFEGFPVVEGDRLIGLLTRRAVDRALNHGLDGVPIEQFMDAGYIIVQPGDSIATLQRQMMTSGWGQIPVVDKQQQIIGVVTRTDLIKHLGHTEHAQSHRTEIIAELKKALPPVLLKLIYAVGEQAGELGCNLFLVGGFVRDLLLHKHTIDLDFVVEGDAIALTTAMQKAFGGEVRSHRRFGTGKWLLDSATWEVIASQLAAPFTTTDILPEHIDFATARTEFYDAPTVLPEIEVGSVKHDLHRRDFTINTLAIRLDPPYTGQLLDFYGGKEDLTNRIVRVLHSLSFIDDPTRILRAIRFEQRFGFQIEQRTEQLITTALPLIERLSGDRIRHEIEFILNEAAPEQALQRLNDIGVLEFIHPDLQCTTWTKAAFQAVRYALDHKLWHELDSTFDPALSYFGLLIGQLPVQTMHKISTRLRVRRRTVSQLEQLQALRQKMGDLSQSLSPSQIDAYLHRASDQVLLALWAGAPNAIARQNITLFATRLRHIMPTIDGKDLLERGLKPSPRIGIILSKLRTAWLDGTILSQEQETRLLECLLAEESA